MNGFTNDSSTTISINKKIKNHKSIVPSILTAHALTGCDSIPKFYGIEKTKMINALKKVLLSVFENPESSKAEYIDEAKGTIARCYGVDNKKSLEDK